MQRVENIEESRIKEKIDEVTVTSSALQTSQEITQKGSTQKCVTIIGGGLGGLSAAIHLKVAGYDVTIYEANERVGGRANLIVRDGFRFDTGPSLLNYPWVFEELFRAAGRDMHKYITLLPVDPSISFQWPDGTHLTLSSNLQMLLAEFERIEPGVRPRLLAFLRDAAAKYHLSFEKLVTSNRESFVKWLSALSLRELFRTTVWRSLNSELNRFFKSQYILEALGSYGMYLGSSPHELPGLFSILPFGEIAYGLWLPKGGIYGLVSSIEKLAYELGIKILTGHRVKRILRKDKRVIGIELEDSSHRYSRFVISNVDVSTTDLELLDNNAISPQARKRIAKRKMTPGVLTFYWGVRGKLDNIAHHTIFLAKDYRTAFNELFKNKRIPQDIPFYVSVPSTTDPDLAPTGCNVMFVLVPTPLISEMRNIDWRVIISDVKSRVLERLRHHSANLIQEKIMVEEIYTPEDWQKHFGLYDGSAFGAAHTLFQMGPLRAPNYSKELDGLFYVGASTTPGTGLPMVVLSGKMVAERIQQKDQITMDVYN